MTMGSLDTSTPPLSVEAWLALDEDEPGELVDGRLEPEEEPSWVHELAISWMLGTLRSWVVPAGGLVLGSGTKLVITPRCGRKPDVSVYLGRRRRRAAPPVVRPDIVVEVIEASPHDRQRDRIHKCHDYATLGVGQCWLVDPAARTLEILALDPDRRFRPVLAAAEGTHEVPGCEGLRLDLDALWNEVDHGAAFFTDEVTDSGS